MRTLIDTIEAGWDQKVEGKEIRGNSGLEDAVSHALTLLDSGELRVAEKIDHVWQVNQWLKKAVLLSFHLTDSKMIAGASSNYFDKVPLKYSTFGQKRSKKSSVVMKNIDKQMKNFNYEDPNFIINYNHHA